MRRMLACSLLVVALAAGLRIPSLPWWGLVAGLSVLAVLAWRLSMCPHDGTPALLPATTDLDGTRLPARWHCDACGATWPANFDKVQTPVRKFTGYDETKAVNAAKRAAELADRQRVLALQRAGLRPAAGPRRAKAGVQSALGADVAPVVPIGQGRRLAG